MILTNKQPLRLALIALAAGLGIAAAQQSCPQLPPDAVISVRMLQPIDSATSKAGDTFEAVLEHPIQQGGKVIARRGAAAKVRLVQVVQPEGSTAPPLLALQLAEVNMEGKACPYVTGFAKVHSGIRKVRYGHVPEGTTSIEVIVDAMVDRDPLGPSEEAIVDGAGVSFEVVSGQRVKVSKNAVLRFDVADMWRIGGRKGS